MNLIVPSFDPKDRRWKDMNMDKTKIRLLLDTIREKINSLKEVEKDLLIQVKENVDKYIKELGIEGAWELIERNSDQSCARLYFEEFKRRGINLKS